MSTSTKLKRLSPEIEQKYVEQNQFTLQRYKLRELVSYLPQAKAMSLIRHLFECNYEESLTIWHTMLRERD